MAWMIFLLLIGLALLPGLFRAATPGDSAAGDAPAAAAADTAP